MRKNVFGRKFSRPMNQRKALFKSLLSSLVLEERIKTTEEKAKAIKGQVDKLITKVKKKGELSHNVLQLHLNEEAIKKLITEISPRFLNRNGGYTRTIRIGKRNDSSSMVYLEWVEMASQIVEVKKEDEKTKAKETEKKEEKISTKIKSIKKSEEPKKTKTKEKTKEKKG